MEIEGKIIMDLPLQEGISKAGNSWKKKEWVLETLGQYPKKVKFHVFGDRVNTVNLEVGQIYTISVDVESREFNGRWYTDINCFAARLSTPGVADPMVGGMPQPAAAPATPTFGQPAEAPTFTPSDGNDNDDLPF